jgi:hypothetical protein
MKRRYKQAMKLKIEASDGTRIEASDETKIQASDASEGSVCGRRKEETEGIDEYLDLLCLFLGQGLKGECLVILKKTVDK